MKARVVYENGFFIEVETMQLNAAEAIAIASKKHVVSSIVYAVTFDTFIIPMRGRAA